MKEKDHLSNIQEVYDDWFLDYASYVILERAVPHLNDVKLLASMPFGTNSVWRTVRGELRKYFLVSYR